MTNNALQVYIANNVVEIKFTRRHPVAGWNDIRGLLGTTNPTVLNSPFGFEALHFQPPNGKGMSYDYKSKNLCVIWDMMRQEYRVFGAEQVEIVQSFNVTTPEGIYNFEKYMKDFIFKMSEAQKLNFMGYSGQTEILNNPKSPDSAKKSIKQWASDKYNAFASRFKNFFKM